MFTLEQRPIQSVDQQQCCFVNCTIEDMTKSEMISWMLFVRCL